MEWNAEKYHKTCGRVTEHGVKLVDILKNYRVTKVLDIGCGTGVLTHEIAGFTHEVIGIDSSQKMIDKARTMYPELELVVGDARCLKWEEYFDAVFSNAVFHFIKEQDILLNSIYKALVPEGLVVCEFGAAGNISGLLDAIDYACRKREKLFTLRFYYPTETEYKHLLKNHGFFVESITVYDLDTELTEGEAGLRNWVNQIFNIEMELFDKNERNNVLSEIELALKSEQWDGTNWHLPNRRLQFVARKAM